MTDSVTICPKCRLETRNEKGEKVVYDAGVTYEVAPEFADEIAPYIEIMETPAPRKATTRTAKK